MFWHISEQLINCDMSVLLAKKSLNFVFQVVFATSSLYVATRPYSCSKALWKDPPDMTFTGIKGLPPSSGHMVPRVQGVMMNDQSKQHAIALPKTTSKRPWKVTCPCGMAYLQRLC